MRKFLFAVFLLAFLSVAGGVFALYYIRPDPSLSLDYQSLSMKKEALDMVKRASFELVLDEEDINNLLRKSLAENPRRGKDVEVRGAAFQLSGDRLDADFSLIWKNRVPAGLHVVYRLDWRQPDLIATVEQVKLKDIELPAVTVQNMRIPIGGDLPKPLKIKDVKFGGREMTVVLQKPGLKDLAELIG